LGAAVMAPHGAASERLPELRRYVADCVADRPANAPRAVAIEIPIACGDETVGCVVLLEGAAATIADAAEYLHLAAVASLTELAVEEARDEVEQNLRGSFLEDLRTSAGLPPDELVRRAARLGCDLSHGAVALCAELHSDRPRHVVATIAEDMPGALAQHMENVAGASQSGRVYALLPANGSDQAAEKTLAAAARLAARLQRHGTVGLSSFYADPAELGRAVQEAELVLDVLTVSGEPIAEDINQGTYRLLFRVLASHPEEVRSFYEDTVAPVVRYDDQYRTDLVGTLEAYLAANCHMSATAAAIHAHRHTVAYRLERVRDLTGLDPMQSEDRERLGLGLKAYRIIAPRLPR
ncbi:MAG: helix-turn-helix domain-containing protein, partial [Actinomycetota bacterium]|nr:helix-turn-helix domain-containing protein [Actinomycetota bacterium]